MKKCTSLISVAFLISVCSQFTIFSAGDNVVPGGDAPDNSGTSTSSSPACHNQVTLTCPKPPTGMSFDQQKNILQEAKDYVESSKKLKTSIRKKNAAICCVISLLCPCAAPCILCNACDN